MFKYVLSAILLFAVVAFSAAPTDGINDATYEWSLKYTISSAANDDSLGGGADSVILYTGLKPDQGYEYVYIRDAHTGTGSDSSYYEVIVRCYDAAGSLLYSVKVDTAAAADGEAIKLPFGETAIGSSFKIVAKGIANGSGNPVIFNRGYIYQRRPVAMKKEWR